jgi:hypothetical protein
MDETIKTILAVLGAVRSTILAIRTFVSAARDRPQISVSASLVSLSCNESDTTKGTKVYLEERGWSEVRIQIRVRNQGSRSLQIVSVFVQDSKATHQIFPENIPSILEPRTQLETTIQKEWVDNVDVQALGVLDATGKRHDVPVKQVHETIEKSNALPSNKRKYRHKETGEEVEAFELADRTTVNAKLD